jgi:predicted TIM-barrel fold metal-dependent hydrolase
MDDEAPGRTAELAFYKAEIAPHLPPAVLDFHAHIWSRSSWRSVPWEGSAKGSTYMVTGEEYPVERLLADARCAFPDREYRAVCFGHPGPQVDNEKDTAMVAAAGRTRGIYPLMVAGAELGVPQEVLRRRVDEHRFLGYKVFLNWLGDDYGNRRVEDMLSANEMDLAEERGLVVLLHVPRAGRLADPEIQRGVQWLAGSWPNTKIVLAHCGRCYLPAEMEKAIRSIRGLPNVWMDTAMVMDETVLQIAFDTIGPGRILFATDYPVAAMRGRRVRVMDHWVDIVTPGYPPSAWRVPAQGIHATSMAREIAAAVLGAARRARLSRQDTHGVFFDNGMRVLAGVDGGQAVRRVEEAWTA